MDFSKGSKAHSKEKIIGIGLRRLISCAQQSDNGSTRSRDGKSLAEKSTQLLSLTGRRSQNARGLVV